jgi:hypothetical protein
VKFQGNELKAGMREGVTSQTNSNTYFYTRFSHNLLAQNFADGERDEDGVVSLGTRVAHPSDGFNGGFLCHTASLVSQDFFNKSKVHSMNLIAERTQKKSNN